jgi:hypothetical protein
VHPHGEEVLARQQMLADLVLHREAAALAVAEEHAVQPHGSAGVDPLEAQHRARATPVVRQGEGPTVVARRVLLGHARWIDRDRERGVRVQRLPVALEDPVRRDPDAIPGGVVERRIAEGVARSVGRRREGERPVAVEGQSTCVAQLVGTGATPTGPRDRVLDPRRCEPC